MSVRVVLSENIRENCEKLKVPTTGSDTEVHTHTFSSWLWFWCRPIRSHREDGVNTQTARTQEQSNTTWRRWHHRGRLTVSQSCDCCLVKIKYSYNTNAVSLLYKAHTRSWCLLLCGYRVSTHANCHRITHSRSVTRFLRPAPLTSN